MTAREKFAKGDRVAKSERHPAHLPQPHRRGTVIGFGHQRHIVRVRQDGLKSIDSYHMDFWERIEDSK